MRTITGGEASPLRELPDFRNLAVLIVRKNSKILGYSNFTGVLFVTFVLINNLLNTTIMFSSMTSLTAQDLRDVQGGTNDPICKRPVIFDSTPDDHR